MEKIIIEGGYRLQGRVKISGAKNAALPIMTACLLTDEKCIIRNAPDVVDVATLSHILGELGVRVDGGETGTLEIKVESEENSIAPYDMVRKMRASFCTLGPLLARRRRARVSLPGGCVIGLRPIDLHLKGLRALGARIDVEGGYVLAEAPRLHGAKIYLGGPFGSSVTGTANVMMAATLARGTTTIECAACEPETEDLAHFLNKMGAKISGMGTPRITIQGVDSLHGAEYEIIPDRIEAATYIIAAAITQGDITVEGVQLEHLAAVVDKLSEIGVVVTGEDKSLKVIAPAKFASTDLVTLPYPGIPTDLQAQFTTLLALADGISVVTEKIFPDRFMHIAELNRLGATIRKEGPHAIITGVSELSGAPVMASDLRASAALILAGLVARGKTIVNRVYHLDRGYERIVEKLSRLGAQISRIEDERGSSEEVIYT